MKTLVLLLVIAVGTAALLFLRVNLGMSWEDITAVVKGDLLPRMLSLLVVVGALAFTVSYISRRD